MATPVLAEIPDKRDRQITSGAGWTGWKHIRWFNCPKGDVAYHLANELAPGAVLPVKWGGVATSTAADPRIQMCEDRQQQNGAQAQLYTEWVEITVTA